MGNIVMGGNIVIGASFCRCCWCCLLQIVHELLGTPEGCELYLLPPVALGCSEGETLRFAELQAVGRLIDKTVIGVVSGGRVVLAPGREWRWSVQEADKVAVLAVSWEC
jgi:hypothetical protein